MTKDKYLVLRDDYHCDICDEVMYTTKEKFLEHYTDCEGDQDENHD